MACIFFTFQSNLDYFIKILMNFCNERQFNVSLCKCVFTQSRGSNFQNHSGVSFVTNPQRTPSPSFLKIPASAAVESINPFLANVPTLYPLKSPENQRVSGVVRGYKIRPLAKKGLKLSRRVVQNGSNSLLVKPFRLRNLA